ncbi:MAG TPA: hypothetical protein VLW49_07605 [Gaiellaceae bacterium]|nr:hypothetical protein [Gaiellaceae bacterium]
MAGNHGPSFEETVTLAETYAGLSPQAQRVVLLLARLPARVADSDVRAETRAFLLACLDAGVDPGGVERARAVLAAYEGVLGEEQFERVLEGERIEGVRRVA